MDLTSYAYPKAVQILSAAEDGSTESGPSKRARLDGAATPPATPPAATVTGELQLPLPLFLIFD